MFTERLQAQNLEQSLSRTKQTSGILGTDVAELQELAASIKALPKKSVPTPSQHRQYLHAALAAPIAHGNRLVRLSAYFSGAALVLGMALVGIVAVNSAPGAPLYSLKSGSQNIRLSLVNDENSRVNLQLEFAEQRLAETKQILNSDATPAAKSAAISELTTRNLATVETVKRLAVAQKNSALLNRLSTITNDQTTVISSANQSDPTVQNAAKDALLATAAGSKIIAEAKQIVAASNDSTIAKLPKTISGTISKVSDKELTVAKISIIITDQTEILIAGKNTETKPTLKVGQQITVSAIEEDKTYTAQRITINADPASKVKGATTESPEAKQDQPTTDSTENNKESQATVQSGFLLESPEPQYPKN